MEDIIRASAWSNNSIFAKFYLRDLSRQSKNLSTGSSGFDSKNRRGEEGRWAFLSDGCDSYAYSSPFLKVIG